MARVAFMKRKLKGSEKQSGGSDVDPSVVSAAAAVAAAHDEAGRVLFRLSWPS